MRVSVARSTRLQRAPESGAAALGVEAERGGVAIDVPDVAPPVAWPAVEASTVHTFVASSDGSPASWTPFPCCRRRL